MLIIHAGDSELVAVDCFGCIDAQLDVREKLRHASHVSHADLVQSCLMKESRIPFMTVMLCVFLCTFYHRLNFGSTSRTRIFKVPRFHFLYVDKSFNDLIGTNCSNP